jgi:hypothetical protein
LRHIPASRKNIPPFLDSRRFVTYVFDGSHLAHHPAAEGYRSPLKTFPNGQLPDRMSALWSIVRHSFLHIHHGPKKEKNAR